MITFLWYLAMAILAVWLLITFFLALGLFIAWIDSGDETYARMDENEKYMKTRERNGDGVP
jgi:hypothetical protein